METKARYLLVGTCTIVAVLLFTGFLIFSTSKNEEVSLYAVYFHGGVSGLSVGNNVLFNGVPVGSVKEMGLSEQDQSQVRVVIEITSKVIIRQDCLATLNAQGITGMSTILITGGSSSSPRLDTASDNSDDALPVIPAGKSTLESLAGGIPELVSSAAILMNRMGEVFSDENVENLRSTIESLAKISSALWEEGNALHAALSNLHQGSEHLNRLLENANKLVNGEAKSTMISVQHSFDRINSFIAKLEPELLKFSSNSVDSLNQLLLDTRTLVRNLDDLVREINANPRGFLFGTNVPEYQPR